MTDRDAALSVMARAISRLVYRDAYEAAEQALTAYESHLQASGMAVVPGWQPIETAPIWEWDTPRFRALLYSPSLGIVTGECGRFMGEAFGHVAAFSGNAVKDWGVTHFMLLPSPPASPDGKALMQEKKDG